MRILFVAPQCVGFSGIYGGVYSEMRNRAYALERLGHSVSYYNSWENLDFKSYDVCHIFMANADVYNIVREFYRKLPLVVSPIIDRYEGNWLLRVMAKIDGLIPGCYTNLGKCRDICAMAEVVIARSTDEVIRIEKGLGIKGKTVKVLSPLRLPDNLGQGESGTASGKKILFLGDMGNSRKNIFRLVKSFSGLKEGELLLAGKLPEGARKHELERLCGENPKVSLLGPQTEANKWQLVRNCAVFILPSLIEGIGLSAVEAGLLGKTVVVYKNGGARDYFGECAYYVDPFSISSMAEGIAKALSKPLNAGNYLRSILNPVELGNKLCEAYSQAQKDYRHET